MNNIEFKNIINLSFFDLKCHRKYISGFTLALTGFISLYMVFFPYIQDIGMAKFEVLPPEMLELFSISEISDLQNYNSYYSMIMNIILIAMSIFATSFACGIFTGQENDGTIEFFSTLKVSRAEIYLSKVLSLFIVISIALFFVNAAGISIAYIFNFESFDYIDFIISAKSTAIIPFFFGFIAIMLGGIKTKYGNNAICSSIIFTSYMLGYLGTLLKDDGEFLLYFSPFQLFGGDKPFTEANLVLTSSIIYLTLTVIMIIIGYHTYKRRDLKL